MRETRPSGSEGGGAGEPALPTPITWTSEHACRELVPNQGRVYRAVPRLILSVTMQIIVRERPLY
jgi:hypothetical protein